MTRISLAIILAMLFTVSVACGDAFPVAPLAPVTTTEGAEVYRLQNTWMEVLVDPEAGGVVSIRHRDGENLVGGTVATHPAHGELPYPVLSAGMEEPPPPRWQSRGWITGDGTRVVMLTQTFSHPLHVRVTRLVQLPPDSRMVVWNTRMTALAPSVSPPAPHLAFLPVFEAGSLWSRRPPDPTDEAAAPWLRSAPRYGRADFTEFAVESNSLLSHWKSVWSLEDGETLPATLKVGDDALNCVPALPETLPPQGWTLVHDLVLTLHPLSEDQTAADLLPAR